VSGELQEGPRFEGLRYAQCWEDADVLMSGLEVQPGNVCLAIASGGDNALALLSGKPNRVVAIDLNPAQLACLELKVAAFRELELPEILELWGSRPSTRRRQLFGHCQRHLSGSARRYWDPRAAQVARGICSLGKFERYLALLRGWILPVMHPSSRVAQLLAQKGRPEREAFYRLWNNRRWRFLFALCSSPLLLGRLGRDPSLFRFAERQETPSLLERARHGLTVQEPWLNPYLHWALTGRHGDALPFALRPENFALIRGQLDRLEWHCSSLEDYLDHAKAGSIDRFSLSNVFEYVSPAAYHRLLEKVLRAARGAARLVYWNFLVRRSRPEHLKERLVPCGKLGDLLHSMDKTFLNQAVIVEQVVHRIE